MRFLLILSLLTLSILAKPFDFGIVGTLYEIEEENGNDMIQRGIKELNTTKITKDLVEQVNKAYISKMKIIESSENKSSTKKDLFPARWDIKDPQGNIIKRKGELILSQLPLGISLDICFIDGSDDKEVIDHIVSDFGKCIYFVNNRDSREFENTYSYESYPMGVQSIDYLDRFNIKVFPTKITKKGENITTKTIDIISLKRKLKSVQYD